jgi:hypothetical protein
MPLRYVMKRAPAIEGVRDLIALSVVERDRPECFTELPGRAAPWTTWIRLLTTSDGATSDGAGDAGDDICNGATFAHERA